MSIHKYASNVIERCLHFGTKEEKNKLIDEIILRGDKMHNSLISLVKDKFGNYVVQKMIEYSDKDKRDQIINKILSSSLIIRNDGYTKHVLNYIEKLGYAINNSDNEDSNSNSFKNIPNVNIVSKVNNELNLNEKITSDNDSYNFNEEEYEDNKDDESEDANDQIISGNFRNVNIKHFINNNLNVNNMDNNNFQQKSENNDNINRIGNSNAIQHKF